MLITRSVLFMSIKIVGFVCVSLRTCCVHVNPWPLCCLWFFIACYRLLSPRAKSLGICCLVIALLWASNGHPQPVNSIYCEPGLSSLQKAMSGRRSNQRIRSTSYTSGGEVTLSMVNAMFTLLQNLTIASHQCTR